MLRDIKNEYFLWHLTILWENCSILLQIDVLQATNLHRQSGVFTNRINKVVYSWYSPFHMQCDMHIWYTLCVTYDCITSYRQATYYNDLTHRGGDKMAAILQTTFSNAFSWMKRYELRLKFHWRFFLRVQLTILQHWFRKWLGALQARSHDLNQWWLVHRRIYASLGLNELIKEHIGFSNHWHPICLPNHVFRRRSNKTSKFHVTGLCDGIHQRRWIPSQRTGNIENVFIWWQHHAYLRWYISWLSYMTGREYHRE